jgi:hypothetical protein
MASNRSRLLVSLAVAGCQLAASPLLFAAGRKNPRDFPDGTFCPINLGWFVDPNAGTIVPPPDQPIRPPSLSFTAAGRRASITLVACDRGLTGDHPEGMDVQIRDFAVVRTDAYESHQRINTDPDVPFSCNISGFGDFAKTVGSVFDPSVSPALENDSLAMPFFDAFANLTRSNRVWRADGTSFETVNVNDPVTPVSGPGNALILARGLTDTTQDSCSSASVKVGRLVAGTTYVIDFKWNVSGVLNPPEVDMLTFVNTSPRD